MSAEDIAKLQLSMATLLEQNKAMNAKIDSLQKENEMFRKETTEAKARIDKNLESLQAANQAAQQAMEEMIKCKEELVADGYSNGYETVNWFFQDEKFKLFVAGFGDLGQTDKAGVQQHTEHAEDMSELEDDYDNAGREEKLDLVFGLDGDMSAKSLRRFIEKYKVVKNLNMTAKLRGWNSKAYRANKLKLALQGEPFDFVAFEDDVLL